MHDNDASNGGSSFRLIVNNVITTLKKPFDFSVEHVLNFIHTERRTNDILCVGSYKNSRKKSCLSIGKKNGKYFLQMIDIYLSHYSLKYKFSLFFLID
jgi:hypothetical protein